MSALSGKKAVLAVPASLVMTSSTKTTERMELTTPKMVKAAR